MAGMGLDEGECEADKEIVLDSWAWGDSLTAGVGYGLSQVLKKAPFGALYGMGAGKLKDVLLMKPEKIGVDIESQPLGFKHLDVDYSHAEMAVLAGMGMGKSMMVMEQLKQALSKGALATYELKHKLDWSLPKLTAFPSPGEKPWEAKLPHERPITPKGFRTAMGPAKTKNRARAKAARKARRHR